MPVNVSVMKLPILVFVAQSALAATCADVSSLHQPNTAITLAETVEAGALPMTGPGQTPNISKPCRPSVAWRRRRRRVWIRTSESESSACGIAVSAIITAEMRPKRSAKSARASSAIRK